MSAPTPVSNAYAGFTPKTRPMPDSAAEAKRTSGLLERDAVLVGQAIGGGASSRNFVSSPASYFTASSRLSTGRNEHRPTVATDRSVIFGSVVILTHWFAA